MPFLVQTLPKHSEIVARIEAPIISGEPSRIYRALNDKIARRSDHDIIHVVMDATKVTYAQRLPVELFVKIVGKLYENWYSQRTLVLWLAVDPDYIDTVSYLVQTWCIPAYVHSHIDMVYTRIDAMFGDTADFDSAKLKTDI